MHLCKIQNIYLVITIEIYSHMYCSSLDFCCCCFELLIFLENSQQWKLMWEQPVIYLSLPSSVLNKCILWESQIILTFTKPLGFRENSLFIVLKLFWLLITHMESKLVLKPKVKKSVPRSNKWSAVSNAIYTSNTMMTNNVLWILVLLCYRRQPCQRQLQSRRRGKA